MTITINEALGELIAVTNEVTRATMIHDKARESLLIAQKRKAELIIKQNECEAKLLGLIGKNAVAKYEEE